MQCFVNEKSIHASAQVHHENKNSPIDTVELKLIDSSGNLTNEYFSVYGTYGASERAYSEDSFFEFTSDEKIQDQVQTYYNLEYAVERLKDIFSYKLVSPLAVFTHTELVIMQDTTLPTVNILERFN